MVDDDESPGPKRVRLETLMAWKGRTQAVVLQVTLHVIVLIVALVPEIPSCLVNIMPCERAEGKPLE